MSTAELFDVVKPTRVPLAERMRPQPLDEILGQDKIIGPDSAFGQILRNPDLAM